MAMIHSLAPTATRSCPSLSIGWPRFSSSHCSSPTREDGGTTAYTLHVSGGAVIGLFLLWRVWHRVRQGPPDAPRQAAIFNLAARIVHWGLLALIVVAVLSGYLLPWSIGRPLDVFGFEIPSPMGASRELHELLERVHDVSGHLFIPLLALHCGRRRQTCRL